VAAPGGAAAGGSLADLLCLGPETLCRTVALASAVPGGIARSGPSTPIARARTTSDSCQAVRTEGPPLTTRRAVEIRMRGRPKGRPAARAGLRGWSEHGTFGIRDRRRATARPAAGNRGAGWGPGWRATVRRCSAAGGGRAYPPGRCSQGRRGPHRQAARAAAQGTAARDPGQGLRDGAIRSGAGAGKRGNEARIVLFVAEGSRDPDPRWPTATRWYADARGELEMGISAPFSARGHTVKTPQAERSETGGLRMRSAQGAERQPRSLLPRGRGGAAAGTRRWCCDFRPGNGKRRGTEVCRRRRVERPGPGAGGGRRSPRGCS